MRVVRILAWICRAVVALAGAMPSHGVADAGQQQQLWLPAIFADGMVLQRELPAPVWGRCQPGATVTVCLFNKEGLPARPFRHPAVALETIQQECKPATRQ
ncbi:MAG: hypothetical protein FJ399_02650 [Verrucomicrobia bacterium]|nr:hypothetical protein [Verrucomicrobiota bacterium]